MSCSVATVQVGNNIAQVKHGAQAGQMQGRLVIKDSFFNTAKQRLIEIICKVATAMFTNYKSSDPQLASRVLTSALSLYESMGSTETKCYDQLSKLKFGSETNGFSYELQDASYQNTSGANNFGKAQKSSTKVIEAVPKQHATTAKKAAQMSTFKDKRVHQQPKLNLNEAGRTVITRVMVKD